MDVLREREVKDSLERQLAEEQKLRGKLNIFKCLHNKFECDKNIQVFKLRMQIGKGCMERMMHLMNIFFG